MWFPGLDEDVKNVTMPVNFDPKFSLKEYPKEQGQGGFYNQQFEKIKKQALIL
jgi:hypothetical protein